MVSGLVRPQEPGEFVEAAGVLLLLFAAGAVAGSVAASGAMHVFGASALFRYTAAVHAMLALFTFIRLRARPPRDAEEREPFVDSIRVAHTVSQIDPLAVESENGPREAPPAGGEATGETEDATAPCRHGNPSSRPVSGMTA